MRAVLPSLTQDWKKLGATETPSASLVIPVEAWAALLAITRNVPNSRTNRCCVYFGSEPKSLQGGKEKGSLEEECRHIYLRDTRKCALWERVSYISVLLFGFQTILRVLWWIIILLLLTQSSISSRLFWLLEHLSLTFILIRHCNLIVLQRDKLFLYMCGLHCRLQIS